MGDAGGGDGDAGGADGEAGGVGVGSGDGDGEAVVEEADGLVEGDGDAEAEGEADAVGDGVALHPPARKMYCVFWPLQPRVTPAGCEYQSRMVEGRALMNRFIVVLPTCSP